MKNKILFTLPLTLFLTNNQTHSSESHKIKTEVVTKLVHKENNVSADEEQKFLAWCSTQDKKLIDEYIIYVSKKIKHKINPIDLFINRWMPKECQSNLFSIPPKKYWSEIIKPLKLSEELRKIGVVGNFQVYSSYRNPEFNKCLGGAKKSKHMHNSAIDFRVQKVNDNSFEETEKSLCRFWKKSGAKINMGLGAYGDGWFHVDLKGYRTWGHSFKSGSSMCGKK